MKAPPRLENSRAFGAIGFWLLLFAVLGHALRVEASRGPPAPALKLDSNAAAAHSGA